jgi:hypothetical protein
MIFNTLLFYIKFSHILRPSAHSERSYACTHVVGILQSQPVKDGVVTVHTDLSTSKSGLAPVTLTDSTVNLYP